jgi:isopentenyl diphosphate isomerase/L-lactate dehydrogenase-like FMN-dependent dehydrogenase
VDKGTEDGISLEENCAAFQRIKLHTCFLNDWSTRDLGTEIFGKRIELPFGIAPTGSAGLMWYQCRALIGQNLNMASSLFLRLCNEKLKFARHFFEVVFVHAEIVFCRR